MIIGIDLGTTYSLCACYKDGEVILIPNQWGELLTPSAVHFKEDRTFSVGPCNDDSYIHHVKYFKEFMGTPHTFQLGSSQFTPVELSAFVLKQLKADAEAFLGCEVTEAVISVPAYFNDNQRIATKQAGQIAGLNTLRIVNEPSAAALAHRLEEEASVMMVFDFGGGTLDVSIVECFDNIIEILAIAGDNHLGGKTVDQLLASAFCTATGLNANSLSPEEHDSFLTQIEQVKFLLGQQEYVTFSFQSYETIFTQTLFQKLLMPLFDKMKQLMSRAVRDSRKVLDEIDKIILVGGSSKLFGLSDYIQELMGTKPLCSLNPQEVVATGMGYYVGIKSRCQQVEDFILTDVCPFTLGVGVVVDSNDNAPHVSPLIQRNSTLPATRTERFTTVTDNQSAVTLSILQGESYYQKENLLLDEISIKVDPGAGGSQTIDVTFVYDLNGILQVDAVHLNSGRKKRRTIVSHGLHYSDQELAQAIEQLNNYRLAYEKTTTPLLKYADKVYAQCSNVAREQLELLLSSYQRALNLSLVEHRKAHMNLVRFLQELEKREKFLLDEEDSKENIFAFDSDEDDSFFEDDEDEFDYDDDEDDDDDDDYDDED